MRHFFAFAQLRIGKRARHPDFCKFERIFPQKRQTGVPGRPLGGCLRKYFTIIMLNRAWQWKFGAIFQFCANLIYLCRHFRFLVLKNVKLKISQHPLEIVIHNNYQISCILTTNKKHIWIVPYLLSKWMNILCYVMYL